MSEARRSGYRSVAELVAALAELGLKLPISRDPDVLAEPVPLGSVSTPNRFAVQPMEGCDCGEDGSPTELTRRRYQRFGAGGAGLIWFEACAVVPEGRSNPHQMMLTGRNIGEWARLVEETRRAGREAMAAGHEPVCVLQLTHSGRFSRPEPVLGYHSPTLDPWQGLGPEHPLMSDEELDALQGAYVDAARLAQQAGFNGVDVKACHGYLAAELLRAFPRTGSRYGGPAWGHRTRLVRETARRIADALPALMVTSRLNAWDPVDHPRSWGTAPGGPGESDLAEPIRLVAALAETGAPCVNVTAGNPRYRPQVNRPADGEGDGQAPAGEHPLAAVHRLVRFAACIQQALPAVAVVGTGYSYLGALMPAVAAGVVRSGGARIIGLGRQGLAYPEFARDVLEKGGMDPHRCCITCGLCSELMRRGGPVGCPVRDAEVYGPILGRAGRREQG